MTAGRKQTPITGRFLSQDPNDAQVAIILKKNSGGGISWQELANELNEKENNDYSSAYYYRVAKGDIKPNATVKRALELEKPYPPYKKILPTNPEQVRRQIAKYMPSYELVEKER